MVYCVKILKWGYMSGILVPTRSPCFKKYKLADISKLLVTQTLNGPMKIVRFIECSTCRDIR